MVNDRIHHHRGSIPVIANPNESPMVVINDKKNDFSIFPPINHENLNLFTNHQIPPQLQPQSPPSCSPPSFSTSDCETCGEYSPQLDSTLRKGGDFIGWLCIGFQILRSKFVSAVSSCRNRGGAIRSFGLPAVTVVFIVMMLMRRKKNRRRNRNLTPNESRLVQIIMEKDGKIAQLLHQIAQMNEMLIERHKALAAKVVK
ncbi:hypothetical protein L195_g026748 [Trifolium pratense]|uniref:Transmembrane protein n=1 Tax=Trifolium pratense TaxID=57577 RepID=A0A2K3NK46_TRIPR|nr:uncharacterized protein LOC123883926 [Trifolium pratense]PNY03418.1 hypothetical protein L195_g026748 [Trifolium pratense]